jgi:methylmalonyl-CoA mutase
MWEDFPPIPTPEWEAAIRADLQGVDYAKRLVWQTEEGIAVKPYYRREDLPGSVGQARFAGEWTTKTVAEVPKDAVRGDLLHERGATSVQEIGYALAESAGKRNVFVFAVGSNYFMEIAKLRAARQLWARISEQPMVTWSRTSLLNKSLYDPSANLMRCTTEAMSAIFGGCDVLIVEPARFSKHLAKSLPRVLAEESHFNQVSDPAGGSYYVEALTASIAAEAWKVYEAGLAGRDEAIADARAAEEKAVAERKTTLVGVNNYPDLTEKLPEGAQLPGDSVEGSGAARLAEPFEKIRQRVEKAAKRPVVLLLQRGDLKMRTARANFALNFFGCAGFEVQSSDRVQPADLIVLCSSDAEYLALAKEIVPQTKAPVLVAGNPKEQIDALRVAGVKDFVYVGVNAVEVLSRWQEALA